MGLLHPSIIYGEWTEPPSKYLPPLEARKVHFCWSSLPGSRPHSNTHLNEPDGEWAVHELEGVDVPTYAFRHDMIDGGHGAQTDTEADIQYCVRTFVQVEGRFEGWWPRVEIHHGRGVCFDVIFLRHKARRCNSHVKIPAGTPEPVSMRWGPDSDAARWFAPTTEAAFATSQGNEEPETAPASEESSEDSSSESSTANATNEDDSDNRPAIADSEREARRLRATRRWARIQTQAAMRQMGRYDQAQNERRNQADMRESFARVFSRGLLRQL